MRGDGCLLYSKEEQVRHSYKAIPVMSEGTVMALFLRQKMTPKLPMALVSDAAAVSFVHARPELADVWDHLLTLDVASATTALKAAQMPIPLSKFWCIWKLAGLLMSPFEHTLYVDADVMVLNPSFASDLLQNSLRLHDMAMPVDTNRPGKGDPTMKSARADTTGLFAQTRYHAAPSGEQPELMEPPMFARGFPPFCTGIIAYARKTEVRRLLEHAGARLIGQLNRNDATDASIAVRQTEQEMMWFELALGPRSKQPRLLVLPEEYYCPAVAGSRQALVYSEQLAARKSPFLGRGWAHPGEGGRDAHAQDEDGDHHQRPLLERRLQGLPRDPLAPIQLPPQGIQHHRLLLRPPRAPGAVGILPDGPGALLLAARASRCATAVPDPGRQEAGLPRGEWVRLRRWQCGVKGAARGLEPWQSWSWTHAQGESGRAL